jgi:hypothetical protein
MRIGTSLTLITIGAILAFAVRADVEVVSFFAVGVILMIVGIVGQLLTARRSSPGGLAITAPPWARGGAEVSEASEAAAAAPGTDEDPLPEATTSDGGIWSSPRKHLRAS